MQKLLAAGLLIAALAGCSKKDTLVGNKQQEAPLVKLIKPTQPEFYRKGENICVTANASSQNQLSRVSLYIVQTTGGRTCFRMDYPVNSATFLLDTEVPVQSDMTGNLAIQVEARDVYGNTSVARQVISAE